MYVEKYQYLSLNRDDSDSNCRYYSYNGSKKVPSVTSILEKTKSFEDTKALADWREFTGEDKANKIVKESCDIGTIIHKNLEVWLKTNQLSTANNIIHKQARILSNSIIKNGLPSVSEVWGIEVGLLCSELYAGTTDCIGLHLNEPSIIDFKNARALRKPEQIKSYYKQIAAYAVAHNEQFGTNIKKGVIMLVCRGDKVITDFGKYQEFIIEGLEFQKAKDEWFRCVEEFYS